MAGGTHYPPERTTIGSIPAQQEMCLTERERQIDGKQDGERYEEKERGFMVHDPSISGISITPSVLKFGVSGLGVCCLGFGV